METKGTEGIEGGEGGEGTWEVRDSKQGCWMLDAGCWMLEWEDAQLAPLAFCTILGFDNFLALAVFFPGTWCGSDTG